MPVLRRSCKCTVLCKYGCGSQRVGVGLLLRKCCFCIRAPITTLWLDLSVCEDGLPQVVRPGLDPRLARLTVWLNHPAKKGMEDGRVEWMGVCLCVWGEVGWSGWVAAWVE